MTTAPSISAEPRWCVHVWRGVAARAGARLYWKLDGLGRRGRRSRQRPARHHVRSSGPRRAANIGDEALQLRRLVADLETVLDEFGVETCDLLGHSMGGAVAMRYALRHVDRVRSLILMDTSARPIGGPSGELLRGAAGLVRAHGMPALLSFADVYSPADDSLDADRLRAQNRTKLEQMDPAAFAALGDELAGSETIVDSMAAFDRGQRDRRRKRFPLRCGGRRAGDDHLWFCSRRDSRCWSLAADRESLSVAGRRA